MKRPKLAVGEIYHIFNRGVEKRKIFLNDPDYFRFIHDLYEFNDKNPAPDIMVGSRTSHHMPDGVIKRKKSERKKRKVLVEILSFCLMDNHFHLMIREIIKGGITAFMRKIGTGYANYFNLKYKRVGPLFQGKFKAVHLNSDSHFLYLPYYIHFNPLDFKFPEWRDGEVNNPDKAIKFLENYRWSSFPDYIGNKNFPSIISRNFLEEVLGKPKIYKRDVVNWLKNVDKFKNISATDDIFIEK